MNSAAPVVVASPADVPVAPAVRRARAFFVGAGLPVFLFAAVAVYEAFLLALVFAPLEWGWWGEFAREFKVWCFRYDPRTGGMEWSSVGMMLLEPLFIVAVAAVLWRRVLREWTAHLRAGAAGGMLALSVVATVVALGRPTAEPELPFPGERIRTHLALPAFHALDQTGQRVDFAELRGRVVLVTGVYAQCSTTCPEILQRVRTLLDSLPAEDRAQVSVVALSLNPEYETTEIMAAVASAYGFRHPEFRYVNDQPAAMHDALDRLQFARSRDPKTGVIDHANLFLLVDARGEIAYRFTLNPRHEGWLRAGLLALTAEARR